MRPRYTWSFACRCTTSTSWSSWILYRVWYGDPFVVTFPSCGWKELMMHGTDRMIINTHRSGDVINRDERKRRRRTRRWGSVAHFKLDFRGGIPIAKERITYRVNTVQTASVSVVEELNYTVDGKSFLLSAEQTISCVNTRWSTFELRIMPRLPLLWKG